MLHDNVILRNNRCNTGLQNLDISKWVEGKNSNISAPNYNNEEFERMGDYLRYCVMQAIVTYYIPNIIELYAYIKNIKKSSAKSMFMLLFDEEGNKMILSKPDIRGGGRKKSKDDNNKTVS